MDGTSLEEALSLWFRGMGFGELYEHDLDQDGDD